MYFKWIKVFHQARTLSFLILASTLLSACGGDGGDNGGSSTPNSPGVTAGIYATATSAPTGETIYMDIGASTGQLVAANWQVISGPNGHNATLQIIDFGTRANFTGDVRGEYVVRLTVTGEDNSTASTTITLTVTNAAPAVVIKSTDGRTSNDTFLANESLTLSAQESSDPEGDPLSFSWSLANKPAGSSATVSSIAPAINIQLDVNGSYEVNVDVSDGEDTTTASFYIYAETDNPPEVNLPASVTYLIGQPVALDASDSVDPNGFPLAYTWELISQPAGESASLATGATDAQVSFTPASSGPYLVRLTVSDGTMNTQKDVAISGASEFLQLDVEVADAEIDVANDRIVLVSKYSKELLTINRTTKAISRIALSKTPTSVSVSPDGSEAIVGHDALISVVDLGTMTVSDTHIVSTNAIDVVHGGNGYAYVFPKTDQWETIRAIELATGLETLSTGMSVRAGTFAKKQPGEMYIYGADNGLSPSDIEKYDIASGTPAYLYDSPYHGDFSMCGNLWFTDAGDRIITACGNTFTTSDVQDFDMVYSGALTLDPDDEYTYQGRIQSAEHSPAANEIATIVRHEDYSASRTDYIVKIFDDTSLEEIHSYGVPDYTSGITTRSMSAQFVFRSAVSGEYLVIADVQEAGSPASLIILYD